MAEHDPHCPRCGGRGTISGMDAHGDDYTDPCPGPFEDASQLTATLPASSAAAAPPAAHDPGCPRCGGSGKVQTMDAHGDYFLDPCPGAAA